MQNINGIPVMISNGYPRVQCSAEFVRLQSPELVAKTNQWMAEFFGYRGYILDNQVLECNGTLVMNQKTYNKIKNSVDNGWQIIDIKQKDRK